MSQLVSVKASTQIHQKYHSNTKLSSKLISENNFTYRLLTNVIKKFLNTHEKQIIDIGCGAGSISLYLASKGHRVTGIDISQKAINVCKKSAKHLGIKNVEFLRSSFPEETKIKNEFDVVILTEVIEHLPDDNKAIKEIYELLKQGGLLFLSTPSEAAPLYRLGLLENFDRKVGHIRRYRLSEIKKLLTENGFKIIETHKTEGILRNFLFTNDLAGNLVRVLNRIGGALFTYIDNISLKLLGESNYIVVAMKVEKRKKYNY